MKITGVETLVCLAGWRRWAFIKVSTDEGITGWADCTDSNGSLPGVLATIAQFGERLVGRDPGPIELIWWDLYRGSRQSAGGVVGKALAAIENALLDIKGKALGVPVAALLGGPVRERIRLYWSHCATTRVRSHQHVGTTPVASLADIACVAREVTGRGYTGLKTNLIIPGMPATVVAQGFGGGEGSADRNAEGKIIAAAESVIGTFREAVGETVEIMLDINMHFRREGNRQLARALAPFNLAWLEVDTDTPEALHDLRAVACMPIASGERLTSLAAYKAFLDRGGMDVCLVDPRWVGVATAKKIADMAELFEVNVAPHNHGSPLSTLMCAHFCAAVSNLRIMEYDVDDIAWRDDTVDHPPTVRDGYMLLPMRPGWGAELNEELIRAHAPTT